MQSTTSLSRNHGKVRLQLRHMKTLHQNAVTMPSNVHRIFKEAPGLVYTRLQRRVGVRLVYRTFNVLYNSRD